MGVVTPHLLPPKSVVLTFKNFRTYFLLRFYFLFLVIIHIYIFFMFSFQFSAIWIAMWWGHIIIIGVVIASFVQLQMWWRCVYICVAVFIGVVFVCWMGVDMMVMRLRMCWMVRSGISTEIYSVVIVVVICISWWRVGVADHRTALQAGVNH